MNALRNVQSFGLFRRTLYDRRTMITGALCINTYRTL